jgi:phage/plasmid primase-like uncharacterized protein
MAEAGLTPPDELIFDGKLRRFSTTGKRKDDSGWYVAYDGKIAAGAFGDWRQGLESTWRADIGRELSHIEQMQHAARMREMKAQREREVAAMRESAAENAAEQWEAAPMASDGHPYLQRKGITNPGLRVAGDGRLMAPMFIGSDLVSLQMIDADGGKRFLKGGKTGGAWWAIGGALQGAQRVYLAEGVATAASIFEATGKPVAIAYSANNMAAVAAALRDVVGPACEVVVVADNDESGTGQREGEKAAQACGGRLVLPPTVGDANDYAQSGGDLAALLEPVAKAKTRYTLTKASDMTNLPPVRWQIKKIMPARDVVAIYGPPGAGKSFMALDMAVHIAEGMEWQGYRTKAAAVVYLVLEAANGFSGRLKAWQMHHGRDLPDSLHVIAHAPFAFSSPADIAELVEAIKSAVGDHDGLVVFVDTLARAMGEFEENDNNDMGRVIASADAICRALACTVALVAHPGKDSAKGLRGGSALLGGLDTVISLEKDEAGLRTWKIEKQKEGEDGLTGNFGLHVVPVGIDEDGDEITSAVVVEADASEIKSKSTESKVMANYRKYFEDAVLNAGRFDKRLNAPFISADAWNEFSKSRPHESDGARKTYLSKAKKELVKAGYIEESFGGYLATDHEAMAGAFIGLHKF